MNIVFVCFSTHISLFHNHSPIQSKFNSDTWPLLLVFKYVIIIIAKISIVMMMTTLTTMTIQ